jgi:hypothetical protein
MARINNVRQEIVGFLTANLDRPFQQVDIAYGVQRPAPSVRREVQRLVRDGVIRVADRNGDNGFAPDGSPRFTMASVTNDPLTTIFNNALPLGQ